MTRIAQPSQWSSYRNSSRLIFIKSNFAPFSLIQSVPFKIYQLTRHENRAKFLDVMKDPDVMSFGTPPAVMTSQWFGIMSVICSDETTPRNKLPSNRGQLTFQQSCIRKVNKFYSFLLAHQNCSFSGCLCFKSRSIILIKFCRESVHLSNFSLSLSVLFHQFSDSRNSVIIQWPVRVWLFRRFFDRMSHSWKINN